MKFLQLNGDSVVSLRFAYLQHPEGRQAELESLHLDEVREKSEAARTLILYKIEAAYALIQQIEGKEDADGFGTPEECAQLLQLLHLFDTTQAVEGETVPDPAMIQAIFDFADPKADRSMLESTTYRNIDVRDLLPTLGVGGEQNDFLGEIESVHDKISSMAGFRGELADARAEIDPGSPAEAKRVADLEVGKDTILQAEKTAGTVAASAQVVRQIPQKLPAMLAELDTSTADQLGASAFAGFDATTAAA